MEIFTYIYELLFFGVGLYALLFSMGKFKSKDTAKQARIEEFRKNMNPWLGIGGAFLVLIYGVILILHIM